MYHLDQLLGLLTAEKAKVLRFREGSPPILVQESEAHPLQGPPLAPEDMMRLLRSVANSRQMRDLRLGGVVQFVHTLPDRSPFLVQAKMENNDVAFDIS